MDWRLILTGTYSIKNGCTIKVYYRYNDDFSEKLYRIRLISPFNGEIVNEIKCDGTELAEELWSHQQW